MRDEWNIFSLIIALVSAFGILISAYNPSAMKGSITFLRSFRILRILRLLRKGGRSLHMIFNTFVITFHQLVNIGSLLMILIYMYSVLGMILLGMTARNGVMNT
jgi:Ion transport protein